jgi:hypothetical protein
MSDWAVERLGYPKICSVRLPNHRADHFETLANANKVIKIVGNNVEVIKDRDMKIAQYATISDADLIILKLAATEIR